MNARKPSVYKLIAFGLNSFLFYPAIYICTYSVVQFGCSRDMNHGPNQLFHLPGLLHCKPSLKILPSFQHFLPSVSEIKQTSLRNAIYTNTSVECVTRLSGWQKQSRGIFSGFPTPLTFQGHNWAVQIQQIQLWAEGTTMSAYEAPDGFEKQPAVPFIH